MSHLTAAPIINWSPSPPDTPPPTPLPWHTQTQLQSYFMKRNCLQDSNSVAAVVQAVLLCGSFLIHALLAEHWDRPGIAALIGKALWNQTRCQLPAWPQLITSWPQRGDWSQLGTVPYRQMMELAAIQHLFLFLFFGCWPWFKLDTFLNETYGLYMSESVFHLKIWLIFIRQ